jgi:hypothetical protein
MEERGAQRHIVWIGLIHLTELFTHHVMCIKVKDLIHSPMGCNANPFFYILSFCIRAYSSVQTLDTRVQLFLVVGFPFPKNIVRHNSWNFRFVICSFPACAPRPSVCPPRLLVSMLLATSARMRAWLYGCVAAFFAVVCQGRRRYMYTSGQSTLGTVLTALAALLWVLGGGSVFVGATPLTDSEFMQASWDWVQDITTATAKWGTLGDWDVSVVTDMSRAFSEDRNEAGGTFVSFGNPKARTLALSGLDKWKTGGVTNLEYAFSGANKLNANLAVSYCKPSPCLSQLLSSRYNPTPSAAAAPENPMRRRRRVHNAVSPTQSTSDLSYTRSLTRFARSLTSTGLGRVVGHKYGVHVRQRKQFCWNRTRPVGDRFSGQYEGPL